MLRPVIYLLRIWQDESRHATSRERVARWRTRRTNRAPRQRRWTAIQVRSWHQGGR